MYVYVYACSEKRNIAGNTGSPLRGLSKRLIVMSYAQNGSRRPASETFDVACKVGCKSLYTPHTSKSSIEQTSLVIVSFP